jgi:hypothetical protein
MLVRRTGDKVLIGDKPTFVNVHSKVIALGSKSKIERYPKFVGYEPESGAPLISF